MRVFWAENRISWNEYNNASGLCCGSPARFFVFHLFIFLVHALVVIVCVCVCGCAGVRVNVTRRNMKTSCSPDGNLYFPPVTLCVHVSLLLHYAFTPAAFPLSRQHTHPIMSLTYLYGIGIIIMFVHTHSYTHNIFTRNLLTITCHSYILWTTITNPMEFSSTLST